MAPRSPYARRDSPQAPPRRAHPGPRAVELSPAEAQAIAALVADPDEGAALLVEQAIGRAARGQVALGKLLGDAMLKAVYGDQ